MIEELNEGEPPKASAASMWRILEVSADDDPRVTFQAGAVTFSCYKSGLIYKAWEQESARGGSMRENNPYGDTPARVVFVESDKGWEQPGRLGGLPPAAQLVNSQLEEGEHRIGGLRKKAALMDWCDHDKGVCTGKCTLLEEIRAIEKKILGDP